MKSLEHLPQLALVVGIDASGKSTLLTDMAKRLEYEVVEPTSSEDACQFREMTKGSPIDSDLIDERERIYLALNQEFVVGLATLSDRARIATTGDSLVTRLSHRVMRGVVCASEESLVASVEDWLASPAQKPDAIVLTHAPINTIWERIHQRQINGQEHEEFWGFNSPHFLRLYQEAWRGAIDTIARLSTISCFEFDTSVLPTETMVQQFAASYGATLL